MGRYVSDGILSGRVPVIQLELPRWVLRFIVLSRDVLRLPVESLQRARCELLRVLHKRLRRVRHRHAATEHGGLYVWEYRYFGESLYGPNIVKVDVATWHGRANVDVVALLFERPILRADFLVQKKSFSLEYFSYTKWERMARSRLWYILTYQFLEVDLVHCRERVSRYVPMYVFWEDLVCCRGMIVALPIVVMYLPVSLVNDAISGLWVVLTTEWVEKYSTCTLWYLYDTYHLWYVPPLVREYMRSICLSFVLDLVVNHRELLDLIEVIDDIDWS